MLLLVSRLTLPLALLPFLLAAAAPASAQEGVKGAAADTVRDSVPVVPVAPLTVTVLRGPITTARAPYAVAAAGSDALRRGRSTAFLKEALEGLPGVQVQNRHNFAVGERLAIRGFGARAQFGVRGVKVLVDGIPATMPDGQSTLDHLDLGSLGRAEVLRGPGSALYGNAAGGVVTFRTRPAWEGAYRQEIRVVGGSDGLLDGQATATGTTGGVGYVASVALLEYDGFRSHPDRPDDTYGKAERLRLNAQATTALAGGELRLTVNGVDLDAENPGSLSRSALEGGERGAFGFNVAQRTRKELEQLQAGAVWDGPLGLGRGILGEVALWGVRRSVLNPIPPAVIDLDRWAGGLRALVRKEADSGASARGFDRVGWGAGVEVELQRDDRLNFENDAGERGALTLDQLERVRATGAFVQGSLELGRGVRATAALRYDRFHFEADDRFTVGGDADDSGDRTMDEWSPTVGVVAELHPLLTVWSNFATSLETPTTTELVNRPDGSGGFNPDLEPQHATTLEGGVRGRLADRLAYEVAVFHTELDDELVPFEVPSQPGRSFFRNAGSSEHDGVEAVVRAALGAGVSAQATWTWVDARFTDFTVGDADFSGNRVPGLAPHRLHGLVTMERDAWYWTVDGEWVDEVPANDAGTAAAGSYGLVDARAGLTAVELGDLRISPFAGVRNLFDESYTASVTVNAFGGRFFEPGPGRTAYVGATLAIHRR